MGDVYDPSPPSLPEEADCSVDAARAAFEKWRNLSILERRQDGLLLRATGPEQSIDFFTDEKTTILR